MADYSEEYKSFCPQAVLPLGHDFQYLVPVPHLAPQPRRRVVIIIINAQKLIIYHAVYDADKENLSFIDQEEPKHSAGHHCQ